MLGRKYFFIIFALFYVLISSFSNCYSMDLVSDEDSGELHANKHHQPINEKDERIDLSTPLIPVPQDSPQAILNQLFSGIRKGNKTLFPYDTEPDSIISSWMTYTVPLYSFRGEDGDSSLWKRIIFFEEFDKIFFHQPVSYKTRFLEILGAGFFALAPFGMGPSVPYLAENILGFLPVGGPVAAGIIITAIVLIVAPCAEQGRQVGRKIGNFFFDKNGFTETQRDGKPHLTLNSLPMAIISKSLPSGGAVLRAAPFLLIFWEAERKFDTLRKVFIGSYAASLFERAFDYGSAFWARFTQNQQSEETKIQRQILRNALGKIRKLINADGSDELVRTLMQHIRNELPRIKLFCDLEPLLKRKLPSDAEGDLQDLFEHLTPIVNILFEYIQKEFPAITSDAAMKNSLRDDLYEMLRSVDLGDKKAVYYIYDSTRKALKIVKLKYELNKNPKNIKEILSSCIRKELGGKLLEAEEQEQIGRFLQEKEQIFLNNQIIINEEKILEVEEKEQIFLQNNGTDEEKIKNILSDTDKLISRYKGRETEDNLVLTCVMSILFANNKDALDIERLKQELIAAASETAESPEFSRVSSSAAVELESLSSVKLQQVVDSIKEIPLEKMRALIQNIKSLPPVSSAKEFLKNVANLYQGMSTPGRWFITLWTIQAIGKFFGDESELPFLAGCSVATLDVLYRITQEWYLQQDIVSNFRYFGSIANDSWPIRWITNGLSAITSTFYTLPAVSILFDVLGKQVDLYVKIALSVFTSPSEYFSFLGFFKEKWDSIITNLATAPLSCGWEWKKIKEERAYLNYYIDQLDTLMGQLDQPSIDQTSTVVEKKSTAAAAYQ